MLTKNRMVYETLHSGVSLGFVDAAGARIGPSAASLDQALFDHPRWDVYETVLLRQIGGVS
jgi:hypothetical protein